MKPSVLNEIVRFREDRGEGPAGKFFQRMLALAFVKAGYNVEEERTVEGPDLQVGQYQIEVKTTTKEPFVISVKDVQDIEAGIKSGKTPALALLEFSSFRGWTVAFSKGLTEGSYRRQDLSLRIIPDLEKSANEHFDQIVEAWTPILLKDSDSAFDLMDKRRQEGLWKP